MSSPGLLHELGRRRVLRVAAGYVAGAWLLIEFTSFLLPYFELPDAWLRPLVIALLVGFPVVIALSWTFDLTSDGLVRTSDLPPDAPPPPAARLARGLELGVIVTLIVAVAFFWYRADQVERANGPPPDRSIAVLPFADLSPNGDSEYLSHGLAEELLNVLAGLPELKVAARTSSFAYAGRKVAVRTIGEELGVGAILEGSVRRAGDRLRISVQLVDVMEGYQLWSETYDRELDDIFAIQDEISAAIARELELRLLGETAATLRARDTRDVSAYELYLKGRHETRKRDADSLLVAKARFEEAIAIDPTFTRAYTGLADAVLLSVSYGNYTVPQALAIAEPALAKAVELAPGLAEAHASRGLMHITAGEWDEARAALREAIRLDPDYAMAHLWYGNVFADADGDLRAALAAYRRAFELEPLLAPVNVNLANVLRALGRNDEAITHYTTLIGLRPSEASLYRHGIAEIERERGRLAQAVRWLRLQLEADPWDTRAMAALAETYTLMGLRPSGTAWLERAEALDPEMEWVLRARSYWLQAHGDVDEWADHAYQTLDFFRPRFERLGVSTPPDLLVFAAWAEAFGNRPAAARERLESALTGYRRPDGGVLVNTQNRQWIPLYAWALSRESDEAGAEDALGHLEAWILSERERGVERPELAILEAQTAWLRGDAARAAERFAAAVEAGWTDRVSHRFDPTLEPLLELAPSVAATLETRALEQASALEQLALTPYVEPAPREPVAVDRETLASYAGRYTTLASSVPFEVELTDDGLVLREVTMPDELLRPLGEGRFFAAESSRRVSFHRDESGRVTHLISRIAGKDLRARRTEAGPERRVIEIDPALYARYVGVYVTRDDAQRRQWTVSREGERLYMQHSGEPRFEVRPVAENVFFSPLMPVEFEFLPVGERAERFVVEDKGVRYVALRRTDM